MRKFLKILAVGLSLSSLQMVEAFDLDTDLKIETGYRRDDARWKFDVHDCDNLTTSTTSSTCPESPESCPSSSNDDRTRDTLSFQRQDIWVLGATATFSLDQCGYIRLHGDYGWVTRGRFQENATLKTSLLQNGLSSSSSSEVCNERTTTDVVKNHHLSRDLKHGHTWNISLALGYPFFFNCDQIRLMPLIGYDYSRQEYKVSNCGDDVTSSTFSCSETTSSTSTCDTTSFTSTCDDNRHSNKNTYEFEWYGPWIGANLAFVIDPCWRVITELQYHFLRAKGKVDSHDGICVDRHSKTKSGHGFKAAIGFDYRFWCNWHAGLNYAYRRNESGGKSDRVTWRSSEITANVGYLF